MILHDDTKEELPFGLETPLSCGIDGVFVEYGWLPDGELFLRMPPMLPVKYIWAEVRLLIKFWFYIKFISKEKSHV